MSGTPRGCPPFSSTASQTYSRSGNETNTHMYDYIIKRNRMRVMRLLSRSITELHIVLQI